MCSVCARYIDPGFKLLANGRIFRYRSGSNGMVTCRYQQWINGKRSDGLFCDSRHKRNRSARFQHRHERCCPVLAIQCSSGRPPLFQKKDSSLRINQAIQGIEYTNDAGDEPMDTDKSCRGMNAGPFFRRRLSLRDHNLPGSLPIRPKIQPDCSLPDYAADFSMSALPFG